jgi:hypothetical protein
LWLIDIKKEGTNGHCQGTITDFGLRLPLPGNGEMELHQKVALPDTLDLESLGDGSALVLVSCPVWSLPLGDDAG